MDETNDTPAPEATHQAPPAPVAPAVILRRPRKPGYKAGARLVATDGQEYVADRNGAVRLVVPGMEQLLRRRKGWKAERKRIKRERAMERRGR